MARWPGTETPANLAGFRPGGAVRCRRTPAHREMGLADRRGLVSEVRPLHVRVLLDPAGRSVWLGSETVAPAEDAGHPELELLGAALRLLGAHRLEVEEEHVILFSAGCSGQALAALNEHLGPRLAGWEVRPEGVHELAIRLRLAPPAGGTGREQRAGT